MDELNSIDAQEFADALKQVVGPAAAQKRRATVQQVDADGTVWVQMPGSGKLVPITGSSAAASPGDTVTTEFRGGSLYIEGNASDPATGARHTAAAIGRAVAPMASDIARAQDAADEAQAVADATNQHFFTDGSGVHVTEAEGDATTEHNILINSLGILLRKATNHLVSITQSAVAFYDGLGNAAGNIVAHFGASGSQIGKTGESNLQMDYHSLQLADKEGETYFYVSDLRGQDGYATITDTFIGDGRYGRFELSMESDDQSTRTFTVDGEPPSFNYFISYARTTGVAIIYNSDTSTEYAAPAGKEIAITYTTESPDAKAYTFGSRAANGNIGARSVAEGEDVTAAGTCSHAEGYGTKASGYISHAEGDSSVALGAYSHAQNFETIASGENQTALGKHNVEDADGIYAVIIGNGTDNGDRSNALAVKWDGTVDSGIAGVGANTWVEMLKGRAALYVPKDLTDSTTSNYAVGAVVLETAGGGAWAIANYNDESLKFVYISPSNKASGTNTVTQFSVPSTGILTQAYGGTGQNSLYKTITGSKAYSALAAGAYSLVSISLSPPTGYTPVAFWKIETGRERTTIVNFNIASRTSCTVGIRNGTSSQIAAATVSVTMLCLPTAS